MIEGARRWGITLLAVLVAAAACGGAAGPSRALAPTVTATARPGPTSPPPTPTAAAPTTRPSPTPEAIPTAIPVPAPQLVEFRTADGVELCGTLFGRGSQGVVLSHMYPTDQSSWRDFALSLAQAGYLALTYDFRGYGCSKGDRTVAQIDQDLEAALEFLRDQGAQRVILVGASMGGTATARVAARREVAGVIIVSAPVAFMGLEVSDQELAQITEPKLFLGSEGDPATAGVLHMAEVAPDPKQVHVFSGDAHGTFLFDTPNRRDFALRMLTFVRTTLAGN